MSFPLVALRSPGLCLVDVASLHLLTSTFGVHLLPNMEPGSAPPSPPTRCLSALRPRTRSFPSLVRPVAVSVRHPLVSLSVPSSASSSSLSSTCSSVDENAEDGVERPLGAAGWLSGAAIDRPTNPMTRDPRFVRQCRLLAQRVASKAAV